MDEDTSSNRSSESTQLPPISGTAHDRCGIGQGYSVQSRQIDTRIDTSSKRSSESTQFPPISGTALDRCGIGGGG